MAEDSAAGALSFPDGYADILGLLEPKAEVRNATDNSRRGWIALKCQHVKRTWTLNLDLFVVSVVFAHPKQLDVELE